MLQPNSLLNHFHQFKQKLTEPFFKTAALKGQSLVETSLVMTLVSVVCIGTVASLGGNISTLMADATSAGSASQTSLISQNQQLVNTNLAAPQTASAGINNGVNPTPGQRPETIGIPTVPAGTTGKLPVQLLDPPVVEGTSPGGPIVTTPAGNNSGFVPPVNQNQQQFSPEYQAWRNNPNNAQTVAMINSLSPDGQRIANTAFSQTNAGDINSGTTFLASLSNALTNPNDQTVYQNFINHMSASVAE